MVMMTRPPVAAPEMRAIPMVSLQGQSTDLSKRDFLPKVRQKKLDETYPQFR
jgi:hypothetical protein